MIEWNWLDVLREELTGSMQWYDKTAQSMKSDKKYTRQQLVTMLREDNPSLNEGSYQWAVGGMLKSGEITRTGFDEYMVAKDNVLPEYVPVYTTLADDMMGKIAEKYPYIRFTIFETVLMNDFLNHLIAQNTIFIQVEKDMSIFVFRYLQEANMANVMYKPSRKDVSLYWKPDSYIVTDMVSEAPISPGTPHAITIEKLLVDMYCDKLIQGMYGAAEYSDVLDRAMKAYKVDRPKLLRYARRRNKASEIEQMIENMNLGGIPS